MTVDPDPGTEDLLVSTCEVCGTPLTKAEIEDAREAGRPFLCSVHIAEELPAEEGSDVPGEAADA